MKWTLKNLKKCSRVNTQYKSVWFEVQLQVKGKKKTEAACELTQDFSVAGLSNSSDQY